VLPAPTKGDSVSPFLFDDLQPLLYRDLRLTICPAETGGLIYISASS
jgi:hypothetical protein